MSDDIQFGDVEEVQPEKNLRPDRNRHFAVVAYGKPNERDLPIFVDLDVLLDMESHAASDKTVELGGVMLGGHYHDESGQPFVVVTDTLRAEHYESTKGSFKFTHETWETISRQRDEFPPELQMAGWYHTHPDWGVFLSGMDMFICDNFFNKMLDVAYVIDPCRLDRAFFQWTGKPSERIRRTGGFYVTASRFREQELATTVAALEGKIQMPTYTGGTGGSPIINVQSPSPPPKPVWETAGMFGMLALQFCLLALIAWKLIGPTDSGASSATLAKLEKMIEARDETQRLVEQNQRDLLVMDRVLAEAKGTQPGFTKAIQREMEENARLNQDLASTRSAKRLIELETNEKLTELQDNLDAQKSLLEKVQGEVKELSEERTNLENNLIARDATIKDLREQLEPAETAAGLFVFWPPNKAAYILIGGVVAAALLGGVGIWLRTQGNGPSDESLIPPPPPALSSEPEIGELASPPAPRDEPETTAR
jgi:proteasome lid subunit RPN8/RPN11